MGGGGRPAHHRDPPAPPRAQGLGGYNDQDPVQRLVAKGVLEQEKRKVFYYRPLVSEEEYNDWAVSGLVHRLFRGSAKALVATLVKSDGLSDADIAELRELFKVEE